MFGPTHVERLALAVLVGVGTARASRGTGGQATATSNSVTNASQPGTRQLHYHIGLAARDTSLGAYIWSGRVDGAVTGRAKMELRFPDMPPQIPGTLPIQTHWIVTASPASRSFEARLTGTVDLASGKTHLVGTITAGPWSGHVVETNSQVFNRGPNGALSDSDGTLTISLQRAPD
jgi:outer membrane protein assembly factor BamB